MFELIRDHQLDFMLFEAGLCAVTVLLLFFTKTLDKRRRRILTAIELSAMLLIIFDRYTYIYSGVSGTAGYVMMRLGNLLVFFLTPGIVFAFNLYMDDLLRKEGNVKMPPRRVKIVYILTALGMLLAVIAHFTGLYYSIDAYNVYHRSPGFIICYIIPLISPVIQYSVIRRYKGRISRLIYTSLVLFMILPICASIVQIFAYGTSLINMAFAIEAASLFVFAYLDMNETVSKAHDREIRFLREGNEDEREQLMLKPIMGSQILAGIGNHDDLGVGAHYHMERYDGKGYPEGLKGEEIPEVARIIGVCNAYDEMMSDGESRGKTPPEIIRQELIAGSGSRFDPKYTQIVLKLIDEKTGDTDDGKRQEDDNVWETEFYCDDYRSYVSAGIRLTSNLVRLRFKSLEDKADDNDHSMPALILFDSYDGHVHSHERSIERYRYQEFGEVWFDGNHVWTAARNMRAASEKCNAIPFEYEVVAARYEDHVKLILTGSGMRTELITALPDKSTFVYMGLSGEHCHITDVMVEKLEREVKEGEIERIAEPISYIERMESDIPNIQIDGARSETSLGIPVKDGLEIRFHAMSLPSASLVWHCPYILLYESKDGTIGSDDYRECALIKLSGEVNENDEGAYNEIIVEKKEAFKDWENWSKANKKGYDCTVSFGRLGNRIVTSTENAGLSVVNRSVMKKGVKKVYVALTGDQCAITDIRLCNYSK